MTLTIWNALLSIICKCGPSSIGPRRGEEISSVEEEDEPKFPARTSATLSTISGPWALRYWAVDPD